MQNNWWAIPISYCIALSFKFSCFCMEQSANCWLLRSIKFYNLL